MTDTQIITNEQAAQPRSVTREQGTAIAKLMVKYKQAHEATQAAVIEENVIGDALLKARQATGEELVDIIIQCGNCEEWFVKVPSANDDRYAHCPRCGEPHEMLPVAGAETIPTVDTSMGYDEEGAM